MKHYQNHEFEALLHRHSSATEHLRWLTQIDLRILSGYLTLQLVVCGWVTTRPILSWWVGSATIVIDSVIALAALVVVQRTSIRRNEYRATVNNCNEALGYKDPGVYLAKELDARTAPLPLANAFQMAIVAAWLAVVATTVAAFFSPSAK